MGDVLHGRCKLLECRGAADRDPGHRPQFRDPNLDSDAGQETDQHRPREKVRKKSEPQHSGQQQGHDGQESHNRGMGKKGGRARLRQRCNARRKDHRSGGIRTHKKIARGPEEGEGHDRKKQRVEACNHRNPRKPCIPHRLRNIHGREGNPGNDVRDQATGSHGENPRNHRQQSLEGGAARHHVKQHATRWSPLSITAHPVKKPRLHVGCHWGMPMSPGGESCSPRRSPGQL